MVGLMVRAMAMALLDGFGVRGYFVGTMPERAVTIGD
jgi:hypothetical protein